MVLYSAARIEYNLCGSVIQKHTHTYPLTQMITWEASSLLGQGFYFTVHCERNEDSYMKTILAVGQNGTLPSFKDDNHP